jgi:hypothetical protein
MSQNLEIWSDHILGSLTFSERMRIWKAASAFAKKFPISMGHARELIAQTVLFYREKETPEKGEALIERWTR